MLDGLANALRAQGISDEAEQCSHEAATLRRQIEEGCVPPEESDASDIWQAIQEECKPTDDAEPSK
jgi:hypothetical protein